MKWRILTIGRPSLTYAKTGSEEYLKRLVRYTSVEVVSVAKESGQAKNGSALLSASEGDLRIVLDERGQDLTTRDLAGKIETWQLDSVKRVSVLIGGADGHGADVRSRADLTLRLGALTLQHELALLVWLEQLYRVHTLLKGEPYHR
ncbi:MAG: 23S rRNA (pseudouridine(1915)-N(3))-methyltransferase RlmH [Verrucomicrobiota bacterium]